MKSLINIVCVIAVIQGIGGFVGGMWFGGEWGFLHRLVDLPLFAYLGVAAAGVVVMICADRAMKDSGN